MIHDDLQTSLATQSAVFNLPCLSNSQQAYSLSLLNTHTHTAQQHTQLHRNRLCQEAVRHHEAMMRVWKTSVISISLLLDLGVAE